MRYIYVTPIPEIVSNTPVSRFFQSGLFSDIMNTVVALCALALSFYMLHSFSKYGKCGRDISKENQEHDRQSLIDNGLIDPAKPESNKNRIAANRPQAAKSASIEKSVRQVTVKKNENTKGRDS